MLKVKGTCVCSWPAGRVKAIGGAVFVVIFQTCLGASIMGGTSNRDAIRC